MSRLSIWMCILLTLASVQCRPSGGMQRRALQTVRRGAPDDGPVPEPSVPGVYWGVSDSGQVWLVYLTGGPTGGAIYEPYGSLAVCELRNDSIATTTFRSAEKTDGTMYRFTGRRTREGLVGAMEWVRVRTGAVKAVDHLVLKAAAGHSNRSGYHTHSRGHAEIHRRRSAVDQKVRPAGAIRAGR